MFLKKIIFEHKNRLILVSDNPEFEPYSINTNDILEIWEFTAYIGFPSKQKYKLYGN